MSDSAPEHARIVADADVLAADLLVGGSAREALDIARRHSWLESVVTDPLLSDAEAVIADLVDDELAADWRRLIEKRAVVVDQPSGDHPALAAAYRGEAAHLLSLDGRLQSPEAGTDLRGVMDVSVRSPDAFVSVFDPAAVYELLFEEPYPGPDRD
ncbi:hypothetical protein BRD07_06100 [Halobacteriales archaeon QS_9_68_42]|nr:MAG: hypothetical protein BRD07_06100 [Halobacteriales archaeon QS_9_68_42]